MSEDIMAAPVDQDYDLEPLRRRRRGLLWLALGVVFAAGAGAGYWFLVRDSGSQTPDEATGPAAIDQVARETISDTETWSGTLGHGSPFTVGVSGQGTITWLADQESKVKRGTELYRLDEQPVLALYGSTPMYRDLKIGDTGADVKQLETNLAKLGYDGFDVDDEFTWYTAQAVEEWQDDIGAVETGSVKESDVVFIPGAGRIDNLQVEVGDEVSPGTDVLDITGSEQVVSMDVEVADRELVAVGTDVTVRLPGGKEVPGTVTAATVVEDTSDDGEGGGGGDGDDEDPGADDTITKVEVTLKKKANTSLLGSPVDVVVDVDERKDVLVVPINALLALSEGGFGLEVVAKEDSTSIIPVDTGLFADGKVEVSGKGIREGTVIGVAGR
ncbi:MAG: efflux RND transporter periplasmic adaptor subunit [Propionibacteriales bacterium]|nr:efflux RND transporter periplasmic adaptor subunit [Propionibacteriales bacterium]